MNMSETVAPPTRWGTIRSHWALVLMLIVAAGSGVIGYAGQLGYAALMGIVGIASLPLLGVRRRPIVEVGIVLALVMWCVASELWSIARPIGLDFHRYKAVESLTALKLILEVALYGAFLFVVRELPERWAGRIMAIFAVSLIVCAVLMSIDAVTDCSIYRALRLSAHARNQPELIRRNAARGTYTVALLFWPIAIWLKRAGWNLALAGFALAFAVAALGFRVDAPVVAVVLGGLALLAVRRFGQVAIMSLLGLTVFYLALEPTLFDVLGRYIPAPNGDSGIAKASWGVRVALWRQLAPMIAERPFLGWGMDASRVIPGVPLHPHSASMQLWLETGAVGAGLAVLFWAVLWRRIGSLVGQGSGVAGVSAAVAAAYLTIGALSFGVWQEWWLGLGVLAVGVCLCFGLAFRDWQDDANAFIPLAPMPRTGP
jgi:O-antigen ligase